VKKKNTIEFKISIKNYNSISLMLK